MFTLQYKVTMWRHILVDIVKSIKIILTNPQICLKTSGNCGKLRMKCHTLFFFLFFIMPYLCYPGHGNGTIII